MNRRRFLESCGLLAAGAWYPNLLQAAEAGRGNSLVGGEVDVLIVGGGLGGCAAALAATRNGARVVMTEPTDWIGGQLTQQAVPPDEHRWIESSGCTRSYRQLRDRIRAYYRRHYPLSEKARAAEHLDPGNGWVSRLCHEPRVALAVLEAMLAPALSSGRLTLLLNTRPIAADVDGDRVRAITLRSGGDGGGGGGAERTVRAKYFIDASELGDLLPLTGTEFVTGSESQKQTGEPHAPAEARPDNHQAPTWCFAVDYAADEDHTIDKPAQYARWRDYKPDLQPPWPAQLLSMWYPNTRKPREARKLAFVPIAAGREPAEMEGVDLWAYRRIIDHRNFKPGTYRSDITIVNWPQNDYMAGNFYGGSEAERAEHWEGARQLSLSLLYWLQTEAPRPDGGTGWPGLRLRRDIVGTRDGLAKHPYIRESRRIEAQTTVLEQHVWPPARMEATGKDRQSVRAKQFADSVGVGHYSIDLHPSTGGDNYLHFAGLPFQVPLGALIPRRMENLLPACKNIGTTHLSSGCYRLHPAEWNIGEAAGALTAFCMSEGEPPRRVRNHGPLLETFQKRLVEQGFQLDWSEL